MASTDSQNVISDITSSIDCVTISNDALVQVHNEVACLPKSEDDRSKPELNLLDLPTEIIEKIVSYLGFEAVAKLRMVNKQMNQICGSLLTKTFYDLRTFVNTRIRSIEAQTPLWEPARTQHLFYLRYHPFSSVSTNLDLLHGFFGEHMERKQMYFFPGRILDEVNRILFLIKTNQLPTCRRSPNDEPQEILLLCVSQTTAISYFIDKLRRRLPEVV